MLSEFRRLKLLYLFHSFLDHNCSGNIDKEDFELAVENIAKLRGWSPDDEKYKETQNALLNIWQALIKEADANQDGQISIDEWFAMWQEYTKNPSKPLEWQDLYCKFIFDLQDDSGDGSIDVEEFSNVLQSFGLLKEDSEVAFEFMSRGRKTISWKEFQELWKEYIVSENPSDPGNYIFGSATY